MDNRLGGIAQSEQCKGESGADKDQEKNFSLPYNAFRG
jgi:hypothetical protein